MDINQFFTKLDALFANKEMQQAEIYMKESLQSAESTGDFGSAIAICSELGGYYRMLSRYNEGILLYEKALGYLKQLGLSGSEHHATTLMNYATTCTLTGEKEKALSFYQEAARIFTAKGLTADYRMATLYNNISSVYQDLEDFENAEKYLRLALSVLENLTETEAEVAITYTNWAQLCLSTKRLKDAEEKVQLALASFEKAGGDSDVHYAAAVNVLGEICYAKGEFAAAIDQFKKAMELMARDFDDDNASYAVLADNTARCYTQLGDTDLAKSFADKAVAIYERIGR